MGGGELFRSRARICSYVRQVMPLEFPGRNSRTHQPAVSNCTDLGRQAAFGLKEQLEEKPYVVIGHSMGSWVCHEFVREVLRAGTRPPVQLSCGVLFD